MFLYLQFLEAENTSLELKVKDCLKEVNHLRDQKELLSNKVEQLEVSLSNSKVFPLFNQ